MASLKEVKNRINSVKSTRQITSAMKMVASAKLHKAQQRIVNMQPYTETLKDILAEFVNGEAKIESPYIDGRKVERVALIAISSNNALCGAYNANVAKLLTERISSYNELGKDNILIYPIGKNIEDTLKKAGVDYVDSYQEMADKPSYMTAYELARKLMQLFQEKKVDKVEVVYHRFKSVGSQTLMSEQYLPIDIESLAKGISNKDDDKQKELNKDYIVEPNTHDLVSELIPKVLCQRFYTMLLDASASEHAARMLAMQTATDNADDLIGELTKQYNKTRQQAITAELLDIIGGSMS